MKATGLIYIILHWIQKWEEKVLFLFLEIGLEIQAEDWKLLRLDAGILRRQNSITKPVSPICTTWEQNSVLIDAVFRTQHYPLGLFFFFF